MTAGTLTSDSNVPGAFTASRIEGASIAEVVVGLSNKLSEDLEKVSELDRNARYDEALAQTDILIKQNEEIRKEAMRLAKEMEEMAKVLSEIEPAEARQAALDSISNRLALISRLITYSDKLQELLGVLRNRFSATGQTDQRVRVIIDEINAEVTAINNFNKVATEAMERFDQLVKEREG
jgi:DNA repair ATPase RecN